MKNNDSDIRDFFDNLKEVEKNTIEIPDFIIPKKRTKQTVYWYLLPLVAAASLLLFFTIDRSNHGNDGNATMIITLTSNETTQTNDLLTNDTSILDWTSPTNFLINEFED